MTPKRAFLTLSGTLFRREFERLIRAPLCLACLLLIVALQVTNVALALRQPQPEHDVELVHALEALRTQSGPDELAQVIAELELRHEESTTAMDEALNAAMEAGVAPHLDPALWEERVRLDTLLTRLRHVAAFPATLQQQVANAARRADTQQSNFSVRSLRRQARLFAELETWLAAQPGQLRVDREDGFARLDALARTNLITVFALYILVWLIFGRDRELGMVGLVRTSRAGNGPLLAARLGLALVAACALQLLLWLPSLLAVGADGGFGQLDRALQSMQRFSYNGLPLSVAGFLHRFIWLKLLGGLMVVSLFSLIALFAASAGLNHLISFALFVLSALLGRQIGASSPLNALRFLNPLSLLDSVPILGRYQDVQLLSFAVGRAWASLLVMALVVAVATALIVWRWTRALRPWQPLALPRLRLPAPRRLPPLWALELRRMLLRRGPLLLAALLLVALWQTRPAPPSRYYGIERERYLDYVLRYQGVLDEAKWQAIEGEREGFVALRSEQARLAGDSGEAAQRRLAAIAQRLDGERIFMHFHRQVEALVPRMRAGHEVHVLDEDVTGYWFARPGTDALRGLIAAALVLLLFLPVPAEDSRLAIRPLIETARRGHRQLGRLRRRLAWPFGLAIALLASLPQLVAARAWRASLPLAALAQSAPQLNGLGRALSFASVLLIVVLLRVLGCVLQIRLMQWLATRIAVLQLSLAAATLLLALPLARLCLRAERAGLVAADDGLHRRFQPAADDAAGPARPAGRAAAPAAGVALQRTDGWTNPTRVPGCQSRQSQTVMRTGPARAKC